MQNATSTTSIAEDEESGGDQLIPSEVLLHFFAPLLDDEDLLALGDSGHQWASSWVPTEKARRAKQWFCTPGADVGPEEFDEI